VRERTWNILEAEVKTRCGSVEGVEATTPRTHQEAQLRHLLEGVTIQTNTHLVYRTPYSHIMPRKSQRISSGSAKAAQHKRAASNTHPASLGSKRSKSTPTRSQYFSGDSDQQGLPDDKESKHEELSSTDSDHDDDASEFGNSDEKSASEGDGEDDYDSNSDEAPKKRSKGAGLMSTASAAPADTKGGEIWRNGVKAGLGPGKQVIIKKPKARPAGKTPYQDDTIHPNTFLFLKDLKAHNDRNWWGKARPYLRHSLILLPVGL